jgi:signal transduction histidine kinase
MKLKITSFRTKIIVTLVLVVSTASFISFQLYNNFLSDRIYKDAERNLVTLLHFFRNELITISDGEKLRGIMADMEKEDRVLKTYLINSQGKFISQASDTTLAKGDVNVKDLNSIPEDISLITKTDTTHPYSRAIMRVRNTPTCYSCHNPGIKTLGYVVIDFSLQDTKSNIAYSLNSSLLFSLLMVLLILIFVAILHYRFVHKSLARFRLTINEINSGHLDNRVSIAESAELGELGKKFNQMLDYFQRTQNELNLYHQKELNDVYKLATIGEMAARLAHEVRNPLMGIANAIEIIVQEKDESPDKPILEEIQRQAERVNTAISNLLKFSRSTEIHPKLANINDIVSSLVFFLKNQKQNSMIRFDMELQPGIPNFYFDSEQLENVLLNLGMNAIHAIEGEGTLTYRTKLDTQDNVVIIEVEDNGIGIPEDMKDDVFRPFFTTRTEGTGLGLAIVKDIVGKHNGSVRFTSIQGKGTTFVITLPALAI